MTSIPQNSDFDTLKKLDSPTAASLAREVAP